jgi:lipid-A-disaccharide synthase-like uncharacterized protein
MTYLVFARWFGLVSIILSFGVLFNLEDARQMAKNMVKSETGYIMGGVLLITIVGASTLIVGTFRVIFVAQWKHLISRHIDQIPFLFSLFGLMLGVVLLYVGFIAKIFDVV